jgi:chromosome segregation ATPase
MPKRNNRGEGNTEQAHVDETPAVKRDVPLRNVVNGFGGRFARAPKKTNRKKRTRQTLTDTDLELQDSRTVIADMKKDMKNINKRLEDYKYRVQNANVTTDDLENEIERLKQDNVALTAQHKRDVQQTRDSVMGEKTELLSKLKRMKEQITEQKKEIAVAKTQMTRMRNEKTEIEESRTVLRSALAVKSFELTELQTKHKTNTEPDRDNNSNINAVKSSSAVSRRNVKLWAVPFQSLMKEKFCVDARAARVATLRFCLEEDEGLLELEAAANAENILTKRRVYYSIHCKCWTAFSPPSKR